MQISDALKNNVQSRIAIGDGRSLVLIDVFEKIGLSDTELNSNIYCLNEDQTVAWVIFADAIIKDIDPFVGLTKKSNGTYQATRSSGNVFSLDVLTGKAIHIGWRK